MTVRAIRGGLPTAKQGKPKIIRVAGIAASLAIVLSACSLFGGSSSTTTTAPPASGAPVCPVPSGTATGLPSGLLCHQGRWLTDASGRVVILHGTDLVVKDPPYDPIAAGFSDTTAAYLYRLGFNVVRLGVIASAVEPQFGQFDESYLNDIATTVNLLAQHGIYTLVDFHQDDFGPVFGGEGLPEWMTLTDGAPNPPVGFYGDYLANPALWKAFDNFWVNAAGPGGVGIQTAYDQLIAHVAARFSGDANVIGYDLFNEPWAGTPWAECFLPSTGCPGLDQSLLMAFYRRAIVAIRASDTTHLVFAEPWLPFDFGEPSALANLGDNREALSFHAYCLLEGVGSGFSVTSWLDNLACPSAEKTVITNALDHSTKSGDALVDTEWGGTSTASSLARVVGELDAATLPWINWGSSGGNGGDGFVSSSLSAPESGADAASVGVLSEPYPQVIAGTPTSYAYDPSSRTFTLDYATKSADGGSFANAAQSAIDVPATQYPQGYAVSVTGGTVASARCAPTLLVSNAADAATVQVTVTPSTGC